LEKNSGSEGPENIKEKQEYLEGGNGPEQKAVVKQRSSQKQEEGLQGTLNNWFSDVFSK